MSTNVAEFSTELNPVTERGRRKPDSYDAILLASFGGPEGQDDVIPFLRNVTRGRGIPDERLEEVSHHYRANGGVSPINEQNRTLRAALERELAARHIEIPVLWGNRNWEPFTSDVLAEAYSAGHRKVLMLSTSAYSSYSSCRQYREDAGIALTENGLEGKLQIDKIRQYFDHPGFVTPFIEGTAEGVRQLRTELGAEAKLKVYFATHSIPMRDAHASGHSEDEPRTFDQDSAYVAQHLAVARAVVAAVEPDLDWELVYQSRSGAPHVPWLEPDINDAMETLPEQGYQGVLVVPLGFVSDHMEVLWDLDTEAKETAQKLGLGFHRAPTPGAHPVFVSGLVDLLCERLDVDTITERPACTALGPWYDVCRPGCCANFRKEVPVIAEAGVSLGSLDGDAVQSDDAQSEH